MGRSYLLTCPYLRILYAESYLRQPGFSESVFGMLTEKIYNIRVISSMGTIARETASQSGSKELLKEKRGRLVYM